MANFTVENVGQIVNSGDAEGMFKASSGSSGMGGAGRISEQAAEREISREGVTPGAAGDAGKTFSEILTNSVEQVNQMQHEADHAIKELVAGRTKNIHETMLAVERADSSLKLAMQVRNKILDAYREIMRMQV